MTVSIQLWVEGQLLTESVAVSSVTAARSELNQLKNKWTTNGGKIILDSANCLEVVNREGIHHKFQIVKYFTKQSL